MIKLYFDPSCSFCARVLRFAAQEGIEFEPREISLWMSSPEKQELIALGGRSQVPFLVDEEAGIRMYESADIIEYMRSLKSAGAAK